MLVDILNTISQYVCYLDIMNIEHVDRWTFKNIKKTEFKQIFCKRMSNVIDNPEMFCKKMKECNVCIAGSFILDVLYGTNFSNDIDIYDGGSGAKEYRDTDYKDEDDEKCFSFLKYIYTLDLKSSEDHLKQKSNPSIYEGPIYMIRNYTTSYNKTLQHIIIRSRDVKKFIDNSFDLDICKTYFDGENLFIKDINKLINKCDEIKPFSILMMYYVLSTGNYQHKLSEERINKYIERGFKISKIKNYDNMYKDLLDHILTFYKNNPKSHHGHLTCEEFSLCGDKFDIIMNMINENMTH